MSVDNATLNARFAATLAGALGARHVVVSPGSRSTPLALAFAKRQDCELHVVLDERAAAFVALGIGRASGEPAVLLCTSGSAGAHYLPAMVEARQGRVPMIALTADRPADLQHCGSPQTMPQARLFGEYTRFSAELPLPSSDVDLRWLRNIACRARAAALGSAPGPVHLNAPFRKPLWRPGADEQDSAEAPARLLRGRLTLDTAAIDTLASELRRHERGAIVCGPLTPATLDPRELADALAELAGELGWPLLADPLSGLRYGSHDKRTVIAHYDALLRHPGFAESTRPTLVLRVGQLPTSKVASEWLALAAGWQIDPDGEWHDGGGAAQQLVAADPIELCHALSATLNVSAPRPRNDLEGAGWLTHWQRADALARAALEAHCAAKDWEGAVAATLLSALPDEAQLVVASSMPVRDLDGFTPASDKRIRTIANRGINGIDGTVATALGAAIARPELATTAVMGDLALLHDLDGLEAAAQTDVDLQLVVIDNGGGGIFSHLPIAQHRHEFDRLFLTPQRADIGALCRGLSIDHQRIDGAAALPTSLSKRVGGVRLIEVQIDRATNMAQHERAWASVAHALTRAFEDAGDIGAAKGA